MTDKLVAKVIVHGAQRMVPESRKTIADWLRKTAMTLEKDGDNFAELFTAKYIGVSDDEQDKAA